MVRSEAWDLGARTRYASVMPLDSDLVRRARELAEVAHHGQLRKANRLPYFTHLEAVAELLVRHGYDDDETLAVAYLHDLLEDQPAYEGTLREQMPPVVVEQVEVLSEKKHDACGKPLPKSERFRGYVEGLASGTSAALAALPVSCADRIHNSLNLVSDEQAGYQPFMLLSSSPGQLLDQLQSLRALYQGHVGESLLESFDRAREALESTIRRRLSGRAVRVAGEAGLRRLDEAGGSKTS